MLTNNSFASDECSARTELFEDKKSCLMLPTGSFRCYVNNNDKTSFDLMLVLARVTIYNQPNYFLTYFLDI